jgi:hypothetical protein
MAQTRKRSMKRGTMRTRSKPRKRVTKRRITGGANANGNPKGKKRSMIEAITNGFGGMYVSNNPAKKAAAANNAAANNAAAAKNAVNKSANKPANQSAVKNAAAVNKARAQEMPKYKERPPPLNQSENAFGPLDQKNIEIFRRVISFMKNKGRDISFDDFITDDRFHPYLHFTHETGFDLKDKDQKEYNKFKRVFNDIKEESSSYPTMDKAEEGVSNHTLLQGLITELGPPKLA